MDRLRATGRIARLELAAAGEAEVVTSPMILVEAYDGRTTERRWDWVLSRLRERARRKSATTTGIVVETRARFGCTAAS